MRNLLTVLDTVDNSTESQPQQIKKYESSFPEYMKNLFHDADSNMNDSFRKNLQKIGSALEKTKKLIAQKFNQQDSQSISQANEYIIPWSWSSNKYFLVIHLNLMKNLEKKTLLKIPTWENQKMNAWVLLKFSLLSNWNWKYLVLKNYLASQRLILQVSMNNILLFGSHYGFFIIYFDYLFFIKSKPFW